MLAHQLLSCFTSSKSHPTQATDPDSPFISLRLACVLSMQRHQAPRTHDLASNKYYCYLVLGKHVSYATGLSLSTLCRSSALSLETPLSRTAAG